MGALARLVVLALLGLALATSVVGVVRLWPDGDAVDRIAGSQAFAADGVRFEQARVQRVTAACPVAADGSLGGTSPGTGGDETGSDFLYPPPGTAYDADGCGQLAAVLREGPDAGRRVLVGVPPDVSASGLEPGDSVELQVVPASDDAPAQASYFGTERGTPLLLLLGLFVLVVLAVARLRGLMALVGLAFSALVVGLFALPALLTGESGIAVALAASTAIMFVVLPSTHGVSMRTATALLGTLAGVAVSGLVGWWAVGSARLSGVADEGSGVLQTLTGGGLDFQGLLVAALIVAGLGVLNDVTITQASAVWELRGASPDLTRRQVFAAAMRIGRDHIASTIYTIVFAYAGAALSVLLVISVYDRPLVDLVQTEEISEEVVRSLASSIGLVLAVPLTTLVAALTVGRPRPPRGARRAV